MSTIGLYFGSFNPIHMGHLIIANHIVNHHDLDEIWLVVSPQNPFKENHDLLDENDRATMVQLAIDDNQKLQLSTVEFELEKPSYTIHTLRFLEKKHPTLSFRIIMGEDNIMRLHHWKSFEEIIENYPIYIYPRLSKTGNYKTLNLADFPKEIESGTFTIVEAPIIELSSTAIRKSIKQQQSIKYLVHDKVATYIEDNQLYR